jgi:hypothetical protein
VAKHIVKPADESAPTRTCDDCNAEETKLNRLATCSTCDKTLCPGECFSLHSQRLADAARAEAAPDA